ncbi:MAG: LysR family transcriptional regulator [Alcaligenaceae bacterium]|nr:LysR family transcriptional regulator [Alcaligenaceae bacterium]
MNKLEIRHLYSLVALRDYPTLQQAAESLGMTQSALSHQIKELENKLGLDVLNRRRRPAQLTTAGLKILELADEVLPRLEQSEREIERLASGHSGRLYLAIDCHSCFDWLMPTLNEYRLIWPDVSLDLSAAFSFNPLPALSRGELDLVITSDPEKIPGIEYQALFQYEMVLAVAHDHRLANKKFIKAKDLENETLITYPVDKNRLDIFTEFLDPAGIEPKQIRHNELTPMIIQLVSSNRGVTALPSWALEQALKYDWLRICHLDKAPGIWVTLYAGARQEDIQSGYLQEFLALVTKTCFKNLAGIRKV